MPNHKHRKHAVSTSEHCYKSAALQDHFVRTLNLNTLLRSSASIPALLPSHPLRHASSTAEPSDPSASLPHLQLRKAPLPQIPLNPHKRQLQKWQRERQLALTAHAHCLTAHSKLIAPAAGSTNVDTKPQLARSDIALDPIEKERSLDPPRPPLTLAQKMGLVGKPKDRISEEDWKVVKERAVERGEMESGCPICQEPFGCEDQVLLSCSHTFHRACLDSFERYAKRTSCPICRDDSYEKRLIFEGKKHHKHVSATLIQKTYRGYIERKKYLRYCETHPPEHPALLAKWHMDKLARYSDKLQARFAAENREVHNLITNVDRQLSQNRNSMDITGALLESLKLAPTDPHHETDWKQILTRAGATVKSDDCAICIMPLLGTSQATTKAKTLSITSCGHVYHARCLAGIKKFAASQSCPLCRKVEFEELEIQADTISYHDLP
ncbi:uncharacterized protein EV422DRAFT_181335 [Fimicolochytrium jonesii]|uniref:uncharacterized protein n=1 Tax=Fimicolochytrium jonesii TaxID=1396493 RepID=UPI0022FDD091|nr:uncharacterized protein EV422DRAFT_181335 [Fimicolochytrium jonesii]KAI8818345.1 hypothetical protein EV422DRAFT_181335 [Fimicolochytrium jonesii]